MTVGYRARQRALPEMKFARPHPDPREQLVEARRAP